MKMIYKIILLTLLIFLDYPILSRSQEINWKGRIEIKNGVTYVYNPEEPVFKNPKQYPILTEVMSIGEEDGDERYMLGEIMDIAFDQEENVYILDGAFSCVKVYDKNGVFIKQIGRKGQGPGEFIKPRKLKITSNGKMAIMGINGVTILDLSGQYQTRFRQPPATIFLLINKNNEIIFGQNIYPGLDKLYKEKLLHPITHYNVQGEKIKSYGVTEKIKKHGYEHRSFFHDAVILPNNHLLVPCDNPYKILEYNSVGNLVRVITKKDELFSRIDVIEGKLYTRAYIRRLWNFPNGYFFVEVKDWGQDWVKKWEQKKSFFDPVEGITEVYDYFDNQGRFLTTYAWDNFKYGYLFYIDEEGYAYTRTTSEGIPKLTKYELNLKIY